MKLFNKPAVLAAGVSLISLVAQAGSFTANDLYLGFNSSGASSDYIIDLGQPAAVGVGGSSVMDLSSYFNSATFNSTFTLGATGVSMGAVGGQNQFPSSYDLYASALRVGGAGDPAVAGSDLSSFNHSQSTIANAASTLTAIALPSAGTGVADSSKSWSANVTPTFTASTFYGASGIDPSSAIDGSGIIFEDIWQATPGSQYTYLGYLKFDASGSSPSLSFTPSTVPEPTSGVLFCAGAVFLWVFMRRSSSNREKAVIV